MADNCVHRWRLESPDGGRTVPGTCQNCGEVRNTFKSSLDEFAVPSGDDMHFIFAKGYRNKW